MPWWFVCVWWPLTSLHSPATMLCSPTQPHLCFPPGCCRVCSPQELTQSLVPLSWLTPAPFILSFCSTFTECVLVKQLNSFDLLHQLHQSETEKVVSSLVLSLGLLLRGSEASFRRCCPWWPTSWVKHRCVNVMERCVFADVCSHP